jgi:hypothetical protein
MVCMRMGNQKRVEWWQILERYARSGDSREKAAKRALKVGIGQDADAGNLNQERRMANVGDQHGTPPGTSRASNPGVRGRVFLLPEPTIVV